MDMTGFKFGKPTPRRILKGRKDRAEDQVKQQVRAQCVARDGDCRFQGIPPFVCSGSSEWAHLGEKKRARTRGMKPEERHTTAGSFMACSLHHRLYDLGRYQLEALTSDGADGVLRAIWPDGSTYTEQERTR